MAVSIQSPHRPGSSIEEHGEEMDIIAAYQLVGTYRGAADICGTTHKTVRRVHERIDEGRRGRDVSPARRGPAPLGGARSWS